MSPVCQNCKQKFEITQEDLNFYKKIEVPPPTFCPDCRLQRRLAFRNERTLYRRKCSATGKEIIAVYPEDAPFPVFDREYWWGDEWDPMEHGREYDFSKNFFAQYVELRNLVPRISLNANFVTNSDYCNYVGDVKNSYLCFGSIAIEDCLYGSPYESKNCVDTHLARECEYCYECIDCEKLSHSLYAQACSNSVDLAFCFDCKNCQDCIGCVGLRNKKFNIFNEQYTKEEYAKKKEEIFSRGKGAFAEVSEKFEELEKAYPHRFATILQCTDVTGDHIVQSKNIHRSFDVKQCEDSRYCMRMIDNKDCGDTNFCEFMQLSYEYIGFWKNADTQFSNTCGESTHIRYCDFCYGCSNCFGCIGLKKKSYCILNKQYTKEEYEALVPKIVAHMNEAPYTDKQGRVYRYGEFFPIELSPFAYNETIAQEYFSLTKDEIASDGFIWKEPETKSYAVTLLSKDVPPTISGVEDSVTREVIECAHAGPPAGGCAHQCTTAFKITPAELSFYRRMNIPLPQLCPNCRHYERLAKRTPFKLWKRKCQCAGKKSENGAYQNTATHSHGDQPCPNEFETSYAPDRKEVVYCEACYQSEIV